MKIYSTNEIARMVGVTRSTVAYWIDDGEIEAFKTHGGHRRVLKEDLIRFMKKYGMPMVEEIIK